jgi:hypothetical protein
MLIRINDPFFKKIYIINHFRLRPKNPTALIVHEHASVMRVPSEVYKVELT